MDTPVDDPVELLQFLPQDEPWLERLAREAGLTPDELRVYLHVEIERRTNGA